MKKQVTTALLITLSLTLAACHPSSQKNPLTMVDPDTAADFLVEASAQGEKAIGHQSRGPGNLYRECMTKKVEGSVCEQLYPAMLVVAEQTPEFATLTVSDLKDGVVWSTLEDSYAHFYFSYIPG